MAQNPRQYARDVGVALAMLGALALTAGGAWLLVYVNEGPARVGAEIIQTIQEKGLDSFWDAQHEEFWQGNDGNWEYYLRFRTPDGGYAGVGVHQESLGRVLMRNRLVFQQKIRWEAWKLNAEARTGIYQAGTYEGGRLQRDTRIELADGEVKATQAMDRPSRQTQTQASVPENYVPPGTLRLARALVAQRETPAAFRWIHSRQLPFGSRPHFRSARYEPGGTSVGDTGVTLRKVTSSYESHEPRTGHRRTHQDVYYFDPDGRQVRVVERIITEEESYRVGERSLVSPPEARRSRYARALVAVAGKILAETKLDSAEIREFLKNRSTPPTEVRAPGQRRGGPSAGPAGPRGLAAWPAGSVLRR